VTVTVTSPSCSCTNSVHPAPIVTDDSDTN
jgi:hypothetical protein